MRRREFIQLFGGAAAAWPWAARAQPLALPTIGFVNAGYPEAAQLELQGFLKGLRETGYVDGHNVAIEYHWAEGQIDGLPTVMADLVRRHVSVIAATTTPAALAAQAATTTIPIVFESGSNPIQLGLVSSLNRPGGNVTGVTSLIVEVAPKRLELLHELLPAAKVMALVVNPNDRNLAQAQSREVLSAARNLGLELHVLNVSSEDEFEPAFAKMNALQVRGLVIGAGSIFIRGTKSLAALALRHAVPAIYEYRRFPEAGGLMSYGSDVVETYRLAGIYTGRVLKGENPGDLPVQQATKFALHLNLTTAKALGLTFPITLLGRADEVIE